LAFGFKRRSRTVVRRESNGFISDLNSLRKLRSVLSFIRLFDVWEELFGEAACAYDLGEFDGVLVLEVC